MRCAPHASRSTPLGAKSHPQLLLIARTRSSDSSWLPCQIGCIVLAPIATHYVRAGSARAQQHLDPPEQQVSAARVTLARIEPPMHRIPLLAKANCTDGPTGNLSGLVVRANNRTLEYFVVCDMTPGMPVEHLVPR